MNIFEKKQDLLQWVAATASRGFELGFVPTMGALHAGHLALVERAMAENQRVVASIFVNPLQFNNPTDLQHYPRTLEQDLALLESAGCHAVFCPDTREMYPQVPELGYDFGEMEQVLEGRYRPGHFRGVAIVVRELFRLVQPQRAYFGEKDYQQLQIIRQLVKKENLPLQIIACPTVRETDGLAMSSRNQRLDHEHRQQAPKIYKTLVQARQLQGKLTVPQICQWVQEQINHSPLMQLEYFEIVDAQSLLPLEQISPGIKAIACIAVYLGQVRLIDNLFFN